MKFLSYVYYKFLVHFSNETLNGRKGSAFIVLGSIISLNFFALLLIIQRLLNAHFLTFLIANNNVINRFIVIPITISPFFIFIFLYYKKNKDEIDMQIEIFGNLNNTEKKSLDSRFLLYIVLSGLLLFLAITSPLWLKG